MLKGVITFLTVPQVTASALAAPPAAAAPAAAAAGVQLVQLPPPPPSSGIFLDTQTPVSVGSPINVDTPVEQINFQAALGRR
ncbi:MAG: hypothetical protein J3K34DRAFT_461729 [Monoraphidium minutum]|nr:MAG: hypothetical protein J3K34DRAFT_461729 [Monoraphidium minutum]